MFGGVFGVDAVHGEHRGAVGASGGADGKIEDGVGRAGVVIRKLFLAVGAVPDADQIVDGGVIRNVRHRAHPPHGVAGDAGIILLVVVVQRPDLRGAAADAERTSGRRAVDGVIDAAIARPANAGILGLVTNLGPETDGRISPVGVGRDDPVAVMEQPRGPVADGERQGDGGGGAAAVAAVEVSILDTIRAVEGEVKIILNNLVGAEAGGVKGSLPILVVRAGTAVGVPIQRRAAPGALRRPFIVERAAGLVGGAVRVVVFLDAAIDRHRGVGADLELRVAHVHPKVIRVVGNVPGVGEHAETWMAVAQPQGRTDEQVQAKMGSHSNSVRVNRVAARSGAVYGRTWMR